MSEVIEADLGGDVLDWLTGLGWRVAHVSDIATDRRSTDI